MVTPSLYLYFRPESNPVRIALKDSDDSSDSDEHEPCMTIDPLTTIDYDQEPQEEPEYEYEEEEEGSAM